MPILIQKMYQMISRTVYAWIFSGTLITLAHGAEPNGSISDRLLIEERVAEYAHRWDRKDANGVAELFVSDGVIDWVFGNEPYETVVTGREKILAYARNAHQGRLAGKQSRHYFSNLVFKELDTAHAITEHMMLVVHQAAGLPPENVSSGYYRIIWTKVDDRWLMVHRTLYVDR